MALVEEVKSIVFDVWAPWALCIVRGYGSDGLADSVAVGILLGWESQ